MPVTEYHLGELLETVRLLRGQVLSLLLERFQALPDAHRAGMLEQTQRLRDSYNKQTADFPQINDFNPDYGRIAARKAFYEDLYKLYKGED